MPTDDVRGSVESALQDHVDEDTCDYIISLLEDESQDPEEAREAVQALIHGSVDESASVDPLEVCQTLFELLDLNSNNKSSNDDNANNPSSSSTAGGPPALRKLDQAVTMKAQDVQTFASGLAADNTGGTILEAKDSEIATYYANMIDIRSEAAVSERQRRKARQKELRLEMEAKERERAIQEAMDMLENMSSNNKSAEQLMDQHAQDNAQDVHLKSFDLPNLRGGGPPLLSDASITLARGRRYGLMGRNGCGKVRPMNLTYLPLFIR